MQYSACTANASFSSVWSMSSTVMPDFSEGFLHCRNGTDAEERRIDSRRSSAYATEGAA